jgi:hypothetical protein
MATVNIKDRNVRGSAKKALIDMHTDAKWAIFEALLNSLTAMRKMEKVLLPEVDPDDPELPLLKGDPVLLGGG